MPCSNNNTAPFDGQPGATGSVVSDIATSSTNTVCNEGSGTLLNGSGSNNVTIAAGDSPGVIGNTNFQDEIFVEAFGWVAYGSTVSGPNYNTSFFQKTADGLFLNGYYACSVAWAKYALTGTSSFPSYCSN